MNIGILGYRMLIRAVAELKYKYFFYYANFFVLLLIDQHIYTFK
jgi:hypothetical protein